VFDLRKAEAAWSDAIVTSAMVAIAAPNPNASPCTIATTGNGQAAIA